MCAGHATVPLRNKMMDSLLKLAHRQTSQSRRLKIMAASCLDTAYTLAPGRAPDLEGAIRPQWRSSALCLVGGAGEASTSTCTARKVIAARQAA
jgi:hypothetical protein